MLYPIVLQKEKYDCGPACICMICAFYRTSVNLETVCHLAGTNEKGTSIWNMRKVLETFGFRTSAIKIANIEAYDFHTPVIAVICKYPNIYHYIVIYKKQSGHLMIGDPGKGIVEIRISDFRKTFIGILILPQK